jgi:hypothetical protein
MKMGGAMKVRRISVWMFLWACLSIGTNAVAADAAENSFHPDPNVQKMAEAYAQDAVDFAGKQLGVKLDWSDSSIANVELALSKMSASYTTTNPKPADEQVMSFAKAFGSYVGEVYRRNHGATWGIVTLGGQKFPGLRTTSGVNFWPWGRVFNRITKGSEDNVSDYYAALIAPKSK